MAAPYRPPLALITGPTASGKSALALRLAELAEGVVINADASQVYRDLRVLTARPSAEEEARAPHRLFGHVDGVSACSAADWAADARGAIDAAHAAGRVPILVGGSGLYIRTLLDGIAPVPAIDATVRAAVRALPSVDAHSALANEDPDAAARLNPNDSARVARALEVVRSTGRPLVEWQQQRSGGIADRVALTPLLLLPPRSSLYARCDARFEAMLAGGAIEEVETLQRRGLDPALPVMRAIGVREIIAWREGLLGRDAMAAMVKIATRRYAKRQYTWFAHQPPATWQRATEQLNYDEDHDLVIKLRDRLLTR